MYFSYFRIEFEAKFGNPYSTVLKWSASAVICWTGLIFTDFFAGACSVGLLLHLPAWLQIVSGILVWYSRLQRLDPCWNWSSALVGLNATLTGFPKHGMHHARYNLLAYCGESRKISRSRLWHTNMHEYSWKQMKRLGSARHLIADPPGLRWKSLSSLWWRFQFCRGVAVGRQHPFLRHRLFCFFHPYLVCSFPLLLLPVVVGLRIFQRSTATARRLRQSTSHHQ